MINVLAGTTHNFNQIYLINHYAVSKNPNLFRIVRFIFPESKRTFKIINELMSETLSRLPDKKVISRNRDTKKPYESGYCIALDIIIQWLSILDTLNCGTLQDQSQSVSR